METCMTDIIFTNIRIEIRCFYGCISMLKIENCLYSKVDPVSLSWMCICSSHSVWWSAVTTVTLITQNPSDMKLWFESHFPPLWRAVRYLCSAFCTASSTLCITVCLKHSSRELCLPGLALWWSVQLSFLMFQIHIVHLEYIYCCSVIWLLSRV